MHASSPALTATLRALDGTPDVHAVASALGDQQFARIPALASGVDPVIGALGALAGALSGVLSPAVRDSPALSTAIASLIGTDAGKRILPVWAEVAPAGWGASHADALIDAVRGNRCRPWAAAALIGPCDASAALLHEPWEMSAAIRRWGQTTPDNPTAWMDDLASAERDRLVNALRTVSDNAAACWPWLPEASASDIAHHIKRTHLNSALDAYAVASPVAHARHAAILSTFMHCATVSNLAPLMRLATASPIDAAWEKIMQILLTNPWSAVHVLAEATWNDLRADVQESILSAADHNEVCAAIAYARGMRTQPPSMTQETARAFFAAVTPTVWNTLSKEMQQEWHLILDRKETHLAVRLLGLDPTFLAGAALNDDLIVAVRRHLRDDAAVRRTLLPIAVRDLPIADLPAVVAALPFPDPVAFVQIACGERDMHPALRAWITAHPIAQTTAAAVTVLRVGRRFGVGSVDTRCAALARAFAGWSSEEATALLAALPKDARAALRPNANALANALAHPDRRNAFRQALDTITALSPSVAIPARHALNELAKASKWFFQRQASAALARALRDHGDCFTAIVGALDDSVRSAVLPRLNDPHVGSALDALTAADPFVAHHVAHALRGANPPDEVLTALATAPLDKMLHLWRLLPEPLQHDIIGDRGALIAAAAPERADDLAQAQQVWSTDNLLALRLLINADAERRTRGAAILAQQPDLAVSLLPLLRDDASTALASHPTIAFASADLPPLRGLISARRRRR
jgi:uncharacterized membrane protein YeaQ/YmgE (transglycosylase-associated protein family)